MCINPCTFSVITQNARDEAQHMWFACFLFKEGLLPHQRPSIQPVHDIVRQCVDIERRFIEIFTNGTICGPAKHSSADRNYGCTDGT